MAQYHEPVEELSPEDRDVVRALTSLKEEIEAIDWYHQRVATASDGELRDILAHNRDEEIEHACMALEWLRRMSPAWDGNLRTYLFTEGAVTALEEGEEEGDGSEDNSAAGLGVGSLR